MKTKDKSFVRESHIRQQISVVFEDFVIKRNKIQLCFDNLQGVWKVRSDGKLYFAQSS